MRNAGVDRRYPEGGTELYFILFLLTGPRVGFSFYHSDFYTVLPKSIKSYVLE